MTQTLEMKKLCFAGLSLSKLAVALLCAASNLAGAETTKKFEPGQLREDFQIARQSLEEAHPGLYRQTKKIELDRVFDNAEKSLNHPMDFYEFYRFVAPAVASIKCGHTGVGLPPDVRKETELLPWLPFDVKVLESKAYILRDYAKGGTLAGREIQSINDVPAAQIVSTMLAASMKDGDVQTTRQKDISGDFGFNLIVLLGLRAPYEVVLATSGTNKTEKVQVAGLKHDELVKMSRTRYPQDQGRKQFAELKFLDNGQIAHLIYSEFGVNVQEGTAFMKRSFEAIQAKASRVLILDVRGNGGGESELGGMLFSYLLERPFHYYDDIIMTKNCGMRYSLAKYADDGRDYIVPQGLAELRADGKVHQIEDSLLALQQPSTPTFTGPVYILINGGCLSTTAEFLTEVHIHHRATFIGEESAGCYYGPNSSTVRITLPNTKLGIFIPLLASYMSVGGNHEHDPARGIIPDYPVTRSISDLLAGVDRDFELALKLARKSR
jgi:hypothetical protein